MLPDKIADLLIAIGNLWHYLRTLVQHWLPQLIMCYFIQDLC